ncbi:hypothetical protein VTO73DRAFT_289 [Trametes versicolor]
MDPLARHSVTLWLPAKGKALRAPQSLDGRKRTDGMAQSRSRAAHRRSGRIGLAWNPAPPPTSSNNAVRLLPPPAVAIGAWTSRSGPEGSDADMTHRVN